MDLFNYDLSGLPMKDKPTEKQAVRMYSRESMQKIMDFLKKHFVPYYSNQGPRSKIPISEVINQTGIKERTLRKYIAKLAINSEFNPCDYFNSINRAMSKTLEEKLLAQIETQYILPGFYFNNRILRVLALALWETADPIDRLRPTFSASTGWCRSFRKRHGYVWRRARASKRPYISEKTKERTETFINTVKNLHARLSQNQKLYLLNNMDETNWRLAYAGDLTWAKRGAESIKIATTYNTKESLTALATINACGEKHPLYIVTKGKSTRSINPLKGIDQFEYEVDYSKNGWTTSLIMIRYLQWFRKMFDNKYQNDTNETIYLILDMYKAHRNKEVIQTAHDNNIELLFVPPGMTDKLQPLDIRVFGALK